jgi:tetratricopeptide (TPR) repeat protein
MRSEHPTHQELEAFLTNRLPASRSRRMVLHLLKGCGTCQEAMRPLAGLLFRPGRRASEPESGGGGGRPNGPAVDAACDAALARARELEKERGEVPAKLARLFCGLGASRPGHLSEEPGFWTWALCEALLKKSWALRYKDPAGMVQLAELGCTASEGLDPERYGTARVFDLRARAWAELANACRVAEDLARADVAMGRAVLLRNRGSDDPLLQARIASLAGSLLCQQRRFDAAFQALDLAHGLYLRFGDSHEAGRALVLKGLYAGYAGDPEGGILLLGQGLSLIERNRETKLVFDTLHNLLLFKVDLGEFRDAQEMLWEMQPLYARYADHLDRRQMRWLEGRIYAGLGKLELAERVFRQVREDLDSGGLGYKAALASLDLAAVQIRQGRTDEVRHLAEELVATFRGLKVEREALSAALMLRDAARRDALTVEALELASGLLQNLTHGTRLGVAPRSL